MTGVLCALVGDGRKQITIVNDTVTGMAVSPANAEAEYILQADGDIIYTRSGSATDEGDWIIPKGAAGGDYEVRATVNSGSVTGDTTGSWLALSSDRSWLVTRTDDGAGTDSANLTIEIRRAQDQAVLGSAVIILNATVTV